MKIKNVTGSSVILRKAVPDETMLFGRGVTIEAGQEIIIYDCYAQLSPDLQEFISLGRIQVTGPDQPPYAPPTGGGPASEIATSGLPVVIDPTPPTASQVLKATSPTTAAWGTDAGGVTGSGTNMVVPKWDPTGIGIINSNSGSSTFIAAGFGSPAPTTTMNGGFGTGGSSGGWAYVNGGGSTGSFPGGVQISTGPTSVAGKTPGIISVDGGPSVVGPSISISAGNGRTGVGNGGDVSLTPGSGVSDGKIIINGAVLIPTTTPPTIGQVLSASAIDGTLQWVTPLKKFAGNVPNTGFATVDVVHSLGTQDASVTVYTVAAPYDQVFPDVQFKDTNTVTLIFGAAPGTNEFRCVVIG